MSRRSKSDQGLAMLSSVLLLGLAQVVAAQETIEREPEPAVPPAQEQRTLGQERRSSSAAPQRRLRSESLTRFIAARSTRRSRTGLARVPNMFGDDLGLVTVFAGSGVPLPPQPIPIGGTIRRMKIAENESSLPQDRWIFGYNFFNDPIGGIPDINQYEIGLERTFAGGDASFQIRVPFASTLATDQILGLPSVNDSEFGNLYFMLKAVIAENERTLLAGGLGLTVPSADGSSLSLPGGGPLLDVGNDAVHLMPYLGILGKPNDLFFFQSFVQLDVDVNGNEVFADIGGNRSLIGVFQDPLTMFVDVGAGVWLFDDPRSNGVTSISALLELHYSTNLQDTDQVTGPLISLSSAKNRFHELNLSAGLSILCRNAVTVRPAMVIPLRDGLDRAFDYEAVLQINLWR